MNWVINMNRDIAASVAKQANTTTYRDSNFNKKCKTAQNIQYYLCN